MGIIPLTAYDVCAYQVEALSKARAGARPRTVHSPEGAGEQRDAWLAACGLASSSRVLVAPPLSAVLPSIQNGALRIYTRRRRKATCAVALFRETACTYEGKTFVELAAVVHDLGEEPARQFLLDACERAAKDTSASLVLMDCCGQTAPLVAKLKEGGRAPVSQSRTSLFLYNYAEKPHLAPTCTFLF